VERLLGYKEIGFDTLLVEMPAPYDRETMEALISEVKPVVSRS
jgi:hypothetical protein